MVLQLRRIREGYGRGGGRGGRGGGGRGGGSATGKRTHQGRNVPKPRELSDAELLVKCCNEDTFDDYENKCRAIDYIYDKSTPCLKYKNENALKQNTEYYAEKGYNDPKLDKESIKKYCKDSFLTDADCKLFCDNEDDKCYTLYNRHCITKGNYENTLECQTNSKTNKEINLCCSDDTQTEERCGPYTYNTDFCYDNRITNAFGYNENDDLILEENKKLLNKYCKEDDRLTHESRCKVYCDRSGKPCLDIQSEYCGKSYNKQKTYCKDVCNNTYLSKVPPHLLNPGSKVHPLWNICQTQVENNTDIVRKGATKLLQIQTGMIEVHNEEQNIYNLEAKKIYVKLKYTLNLRYTSPNSVIYLSFYIKANETKLYHFIGEIGEQMNMKLWVDNTEIRFWKIEDESDPKKEYVRLKKNNWYPVRVKLYSPVKKIGSNDYLFNFQLYSGIKSTGKNVIEELSFGIIDNEESRRVIKEKLYQLSKVEYPKLVKNHIYLISYKTRNIKGLPIHKQLLSEMNLESYNPNGLTQNYSLLAAFYLLPKFSEKYTIYIEHNLSHNTNIYINDKKQVLQNYSLGSKFQYDFIENTSYHVKLTQEINYGLQKLILYWGSKSQPERIIQSDAFAIIQPSADTRIEPQPISDYRKNYTNKDDCCFEEGDSNLCDIGYKKGQSSCISHLSDYCLNSNMNDKCVSYCKQIDGTGASDCNIIKYNYCKENVNTPLCEEICEYTLDDAFIENVCHKTAEYLQLVADQVKTDAELAALRKKEKREREKKALLKLIQDRNDRYKARSEEAKKIRDQLLADAAARAETRAKEQASAKKYAKELEASMAKYKDYLKKMLEKAKNADNARYAAMERQRQLDQAQSLLKHKEFAAGLNNMDQEKIQHAINKAKVMDLLSSTYNIEAKEIAEKTGIELDDVYALSAEIIYDDNFELAEDPEIVGERNKTIDPIAKEEAQKAADKVKEEAWTYQEVLDAIKKAEEEAVSTAFTTDVIDTLTIQAQEAAKKTIENLMKDGITDTQIIDEEVQKAEEASIQLGLSDYDIYLINEEAEKVGEEYAEKKRKELEDQLNMEFPEDPTYPDRNLEDDLNILVPYILKNMDKSLEDVAKETKVPLNRIYDLEYDIIRRIDRAIEFDIMNTYEEGFSNIFTKKEKSHIHKKLRIDLIKKFEAFSNSNQWTGSDWLIFFIILICCILFGISICKCFSKYKKNKNNDIPST